MTLNDAFTEKSLFLTYYRLKLFFWEDILVKMTIQNTLRTLGITKNYDGYRLTLSAVRLALEDERRLRFVIREIYRPVSVLCGCPLAHVERNIRTVIFRAWKFNRPFLSTIAGFPLEAPPAVSHFIEMLANFHADDSA